MRDYHEIFYKWRHASNEELMQSDNAGARVELALRTNEPSLKAAAIEQMDYDSYNIISAIELLKGDDFKEKVMLYESMLLPAITFNLQLDLKSELDVLQYAVKTLLPVANGYLESVIKHLNLLSTKVLVRNSKNYLNLLRLHYTDFQICYINYMWFKEKASESNLRKLQNNLLYVLFCQESEFTNAEKNLILEVLSEHPRFYSALKWSSSFTELDVINDENWKWLYSLCSEGKLSYSCIAVNPILTFEAPRFRCLDFTEKLEAIDRNLPCVNNKIQLHTMLADLEFEEYLDNFDRKLPLDTITAAIKLEILTLDDLDESQRESYLQGIKTHEAFEYLVTHEEYQSLKIIHDTSSYYYYGLKDSEMRKSFLNDEESRQLITMILDAAYKEDDGKFLSYLLTILSDQDCTRLYSNELLQEILDKLQEIPNLTIGKYYLTNMFNNILGEEEANIRLAKLAEQAEQERLKRLEEKAAKDIKELHDNFDNTISFANLWNNYKDLPSWKYEDSLKLKVLKDTLYAKLAIWKPDEFSAKLIGILMSEDALSYDEFKEIVINLQEVCNE